MDERARLESECTFTGTEGSNPSLSAVLKSLSAPPWCDSELVSESPDDSNNPNEILKRVQDESMGRFLDKRKGYENPP